MLARSRRWVGATATVSALGAAALAVGLSLSAGAAPAPPRNLLVILVDTLRADHLGSYGYARPTSPHIDRLAAEGIAFDRATATSSYTKESVGGLFWGRYPSSGAVVGRIPTPRRPGRTLAQHLAAHGRDTAALSLSPIIRGITRGFTDTWFPDGKAEDHRSMELTERAVEWLRGREGRPFFLYVHYMDPHAPYRPEAGTRARFDVPAPDDPPSLYGDVREHLSELRASGFGPGELRFEDMVARYDAEIVETDAAIGRLLAELEATGLADDTVVVLTADHGEELLEHGYVDHAWTLYEEVLRVPLLLRVPGALAPGRVETRVSLVDLYPTVLALLDLPSPPEALDGRALLERGEDGLRFAGREGPIVAETLLASRNRLRAVYDDELKYLAAMRWAEGRDREVLAARQHELDDRSLDAEELWAPTLREELYDLRADPREQRDLAGERPERLAAMRALLEAYRERCPADDAVDAADTPPADGELPQELREQLESLGYL